MDWVGWGPLQAAKTVLITGGKTGIKIGLNTWIPGSGIAVDILEAAVCYCTGDVAGGNITLIFGAVSNFSPISLEDAIKWAMKTSAKEAVVQTAKETAKSAGKEATKKVGQDLAKQVAMGTTKAGKDAAIKTAKAAAHYASKEATRKVGQQVGKEIAKGVIPSAVEEAWYEGTKLTWKKFLLDTSLSGFSSGGHETGKTVMEEWFSMAFKEGLKRKPVKMAFEYTKEAAKNGAEKEFMNQYCRLLAQEMHIAIVKGRIRANQER